MREGGNKTSRGDFHGLLCPSTLQTALRSSLESPLPAREGLKELLTHRANVPAETPPATPAPSEDDSSRWEHALDILVEEFLMRKAELLRLNKARREQIEDYLRVHAKTELPLDQIVQGRLGSPEHEALAFFAHQIAVFHLFQILLVKRWADRGLVDASALKPSGHTLNWQITGFLKKGSKQGLLGRHDWGFIKQNLFSWYSPQKDTWERLRLLLEPVSFTRESSDFPARLLQSFGARDRLALLGFRNPLIGSGALWRLLLEQRAADERLPSLDQLEFATGSSGPILVSGLGNGESLNSLRGLARNGELHGVWAYTDSDFERFLSEMFILWDCAAEIPRINLVARPALKELARSFRGPTLFHDDLRVPHQAQFAACFEDAEGKELEDAVALLEALRENGLLLVASGQYWPTETSERAERLRDQALKLASIRLIVDLRQLSGAGGESLPKCVVVLEKCDSRELRDSNRPQLLRARGQLQRQQAEAFWRSVVDQVRVESQPGEVVPSTAVDGVRIELMAAAASQLQLRSAPWLTLSDPRFYEASARLRRSLHKAHTFGAVLRWKAGMTPPSRRGLLLREDGKHLLAFSTSSAAAQDPAAQFLFLPESNVAENPLFFQAQVFSAPVQFWFRLETEQSPAGRGGAKAQERQAEQRLKLMPLLRLFEPGTLLAASAPRPAACASIEDLKSELTRIFRQPGRGMAENARLHEIVLGLESSIAANVEQCAEFTRHLYPELSIRRWELPARLPEVAPRQALEVLSHLDSTPLAQHPSVQISRLRSAQDFKVTQAELHEVAPGISELRVFQGADAALKLSGPSLLLRAAQEELVKRAGRPWRETSERLRFPTDFRNVQTQLRELVKFAEQQLASTREQIGVMDQIFSCLFGLASSFTDDSVRQTIRHHLSPEEARVHVQFAREIAPATVRPAGSEVPRGFLQ